MNADDLRMLASMVNGAQLAQMRGGFKMPSHYMVFLTFEERESIVAALVKASQESVNK